MTTSSRSLIRQISPYLSVRLRRSSRLLSSSSALHKPESSSLESSSPSPDARMKDLQAEEASQKLLRLSIEAGGCFGFQYNFTLENKINDDDRTFEQDGVKLVIDDISFGFVKGATVDYVEELICSAFQVTTNPSAVGGCGCKSSFMTKKTEVMMERSRYGYYAVHRGGWAKTRARHYNSLSNNSFGE